MRCLKGPPGLKPVLGPPPHANVYTGSTSGSLLGGQHINGEGDRLAIVWPDGKGVAVTLTDYFHSIGVHDFDSWDLSAVMAITPDGNTLGGCGLNGGVFASFVVSGLAGQHQQ